MFSRITNVSTFLFGLLFNAMLVGIVAYAVWTFANEGFRWGSEFAYAMVAVGPDFEVEFTLEDYTSARDVAVRLEEMGIIGNAWLFELELFLKGSSRTFRPGTYVLNANMTNTEVNVALRTRPQGQAEFLVVRVHEGWTIANMAEYFEYREFFDAEEFVYVAQYGHFSFLFLQDIPFDQPNRLEGYLFPDTYQVPLNPTPVQIITRMLVRFDQIFNYSMHNRTDELGLTQNEVVIMASLVEAEAGSPEEMARVAQVIHSRLAAGMRLEMLSTLEYALNIHRDALMPEDFLADSPHNTFARYGLPAGPISNPSEAALRAVLYPAATDYLYFWQEDDESRALVFSATPRG